MNSEFPKIITMQRKKRKLSQKQVASDLGISQALLSHYEKGIRECGLDFVVKIADYYDISCDVLLGRKSSENKMACDSPDITQTVNQIVSLFKADRAKDDISEFLTLNLYKLLRMTDNADNEIFTIPDTVSENLIDSVIMNTCASIKLKSGRVSDKFSETDSLKNMIKDVERKISEFHNIL